MLLSLENLKTFEPLLNEIQDKGYSVYIRDGNNCSATSNKPYIEILIQEEEIKK